MKQEEINRMANKFKSLVADLDKRLAEAESEAEEPLKKLSEKIIDELCEPEERDEDYHSLVGRVLEVLKQNESSGIAAAKITNAIGDVYGGEGDIEHNHWLQMNAVRMIEEAVMA